MWNADRYREAATRLREKALKGTLVIKNRKHRDQKDYLRNKYGADPNYKLGVLIRRRIRLALKDTRKKESSVKLIGCSIEQLKEHLQRSAINNGYLNFNIEGYNGKEYHIDHIIPCSRFNLTCSYHQKLCFNWNNLQILRAGVNLSKGNKMIELVTKGGKKVGELSDDVGGTDKLVVQGKAVALEDVYGSEKLTRDFNTQAKELKDDASENADSSGTSE